MGTNGNGNGGVWRTLFFIVVSANLTGTGTWLLFARDSVKHSEIDQIMATRAPYIHDKARLDSEAAEQNRRINDLEMAVREIEKNKVEVPEKNGNGH